MKRTLNKLVKYLTEGLLIVLPFSCTVIFIVYSLSKFRQFLLLIINYIPFLSKLAILPGLDILFVLFFTCTIGYMSSNFMIRYVLDFIERIVLKIPILGLVYSYTKESASGFLGKFNTPVLVTINEALQTQKVGFLTQKDLKSLHVEDKVAVYLPYAYSLAGETMIVQSKHVEIIKGLSSTDLFRFSLTGGLARIKHPLVLKKNK